MTRIAKAQAWLYSPRLWLVVALATVMFVVLFAPSVDMRGTAAQLSSYSAAPGGARGLHDLARRLGWKVARSQANRLPASQPATVYAVLAPPLTLTAREVHDLLTRVRAGAGLLTVAERETPLADSLGVRRGSSSAAVPWDTTNVCPERGRLYLPTPLWEVPNLEPTRRGPRVMTTFLSLEPEWIGSVELPAIVGFSLGHGRVAVVADALLLTNDVLKECKFPAGLAVASALRYLRTGPGGTTRSTVLFDEFHQGYGAQPSITRATRRTLLGTAPGRAIVQMSLAGILLLAAVGPRPLPPQQRTRVQRRSPLEHVAALAVAYHEVGATRTATRRLVRGLRRRLSQGRLSATAEGDEGYLRELASANPQIGEDVDRVLHALEKPVTARELVAIRDSIQRIERTLAR